MEPILTVTSEQWADLVRETAEAALEPEEVDAYVAFAEFALHDDLVLQRVTEDRSTSELLKPAAAGRWWVAHRKYVIARVRELARQHWPDDLTRFDAFLGSDSTWSVIGQDDLQPYLAFCEFLRVALSAIGRRERLATSHEGEAAFNAWILAHTRMLGARCKATVEAVVDVRVNLEIAAGSSTPPTKSR